MAKAKNGRFKVLGYAAGINERDIEVIVTAANAKAAVEEATKKEPSLAKNKDVRVYQQSGWTRVL